MQLIKNKDWILVAVTAISFLLPQGCGGGGRPGGERQSSGETRQRQSVPIAVSRVELGEAVSVYTTTATLEAEHHAEILARTTGVIEKIHHEEGDFVEENQVLLEIEDDDQALRVKQARLLLDQQQRLYERHIKMRESGVLSPQDFDQTQNALDSAKAELEVAQLNLSYTKVRAPFSGSVVRRLPDLGAQVTAGTPLFEMMDVNPLLLRVHIPANRIGNVKIGHVLELRLDSTGTRLTGTVSLVSPIVDPETGTVKITAQIPQYPEGTRPGDFTEVKVVTARRAEAMLVPSVAVFEEQGKQILFVARDGKAERRTVRVGFVESGVTEILEGVETGDWIVTKGQRNLRDGLPVEIIEGPDEALSKTSKKEGVGA